MEKKEFPKQKVVLEDTIEEVAPVKKRNWFVDRFFDITKLLLGICFLPWVYAITISLFAEMAKINLALQRYFWTGVISFVLFYLFILEPKKIYEKGHKLVEIIFAFFQPFVKVAPYLFPIYSIVVFLIYIILSAFIKANWLLNYALFLLGFSLSLHLVFASKAVKAKKGGILKANYIFGFSFIYILNLLLLAGIFSVIFEKFSFVSFCNLSYLQASSIFKAVFAQLFKV